ncbi:single-stranded DNA-binding protein [Patescibacteria group bacterium]
MSSRSLNKVSLIGNLTRDPELRYTPSGAAVCTIGLATNRGWTTEAGEKKEETEFHRVIAWNKLAELCSQLLVKGRKIYVEGRLRTNNWQTADGTSRSTTEVVIEDMILLDSKRPVPANKDMAPGTPTSVPSTPAKSVASKASDASSASDDDQEGDDKKKDQDDQKTVDEPKADAFEEPKEETVVEPKEDTTKSDDTVTKKDAKQEKEEEVNPDDIPF